MSQYAVDPNPGESELPTLKRILAASTGIPLPVGTTSGTVAAGDDLRFALASSALQPGQEDTWTVFAQDPGAGELAMSGAPYALQSGAVDPDGNAGFLIIVSGAHNLGSFQCTSTAIRTLGRLPTGLFFLDVSGVTFDDPTSEIDSICAQLAANPAQFGELRLQGCGVPNASALANIAILVSRSWDVYHD